MGDMTRLLLLLWAGVSVSSAVDLQKRIVGGKTCGNKERSYHVYVQGVDGNQAYMCGGSLISNEWILTAAHCKEPKIYVYLGVHPGKLDLQDGTKRKEITDKPEIYHNSSGDHDLMLLKLPDTIDKLGLPKTVKIQPVDLPSDAECELKNRPKTVQVAGYGATQMFPNKTRKNDRPDTLQCADIPVDDCQFLQACLRNPLSKKMHDKYHYQDWFCYKDSNKDTSPGDSGGGVVHNGKIFGVNAFGGGDQACITGDAGMNVCNPEYMKWIKKIAKIP